MPLFPRLRAALLDVLLWASLLDGVLWALTWNDIRKATARGADVPTGLGVIAAAAAVAVLTIGAMAAVSWWRGKGHPRAWVSVLAASVLLTSAGWAQVPQVGWLKLASYGLGAGLALAVLPGVWSTSRALGLGRNRFVRVTGEFLLLVVGFLVAPQAAMAIEFGLLHTRDYEFIGQTGWQLLLPAASTCVGLLALSTQLARGKPAPAPMSQSKDS